MTRALLRNANATLPRERVDYSAIVDRPPLKLPGGARIVFWTIVNLEVWDIGKPMARQVLPAPTGQPMLPDVPNWSWHEYGMRVGVWRFFDLFARLGIRPTLSINARVCEDYARVAATGEGRRLGVHGPFLRAGPDPQGAGPGRDDRALDGHSGEVHRQAAGRLARTRPDPDLRDAGAARRRGREVHRRLGLRRRADGRSAPTRARWSRCPIRSS